MMAFTALATIQLRELIRALTKLHTSPRLHKKFDSNTIDYMRWALAHYSTGRKKKNTQVVDLVIPVLVLFFSLGCAGHLRLAIADRSLSTCHFSPVSIARPLLFLIRRINFLSLVFRRPSSFGDFGGDRDSINSYLHKDIHVLQAAAAVAAVLREENQSFLFSVFPPLFFPPAPLQLLNIFARFGHHHHHLRLMHMTSLVLFFPFWPSAHVCDSR
jgi:hypothetical protein